MSRYPFHVDPRHADKRTELAVQIAFRNRMRIMAPAVMLVAIPNEGKRSSWEAIKRNREGLYPGFPDMMALWDGKVAFLEFKTGSGTLSDAQIDCLNGLVRRNFVVGVFRHEDTAVEWLRDHGAPFVGEFTA